MSNAVGSTGATVYARQRLRLVGEARAHDTLGWAIEQREQRQRSKRLMPTRRPTVGASQAQVLLAGADAESRSALLGELRNLLPTSTRFVEASETWQVLASAATSQMVVLTADLRDISSASLLRLLSRRHPTLPVLAVGHPSSSWRPLDRRPGERVADLQRVRSGSNIAAAQCTVGGPP